MAGSLDQAMRVTQLLVEQKQRYQAIIDSAADDDFLECAVVAFPQNEEQREWGSHAWKTAAPFGAEHSPDLWKYTAWEASHSDLKQTIINVQRAIIDNHGIVMHQQGDETFFLVKKRDYQTVKIAFDGFVHVYRKIEPMSPTGIVNSETQEQPRVN